MPPSSRKDRGRTKASDPKGRVRRGRPKVCIFCTEHIPWVDYKDMNLLRRFMSDRGKIKSRANTGTCSQHQSDVALAIKNARELALLPYAVRTLAGDKSGVGEAKGLSPPFVRNPFNERGVGCDLVHREAAGQREDHHRGSQARPERGEHKRAAGACSQRPHPS